MPDTSSKCTICDGTVVRRSPCFRVDALNQNPVPKSREDELVVCADCGFRWIAPTPDSRAMERAYRDAPMHQWGGTLATDSSYASRRYAEKVRAILRHVMGGKALDVGCFNGGFLTHLPSTFERWGIELSREAAKLARTRDIRVIESPIFDAELPEHAFDLVYCSDVVEHIDDQRALAARFARWLAPNGVLVIETGDADAWMARAMGSRWYYHSLVEHVCCHTERSLERLMRTVDLEPIVVERRWHETPKRLLEAYGRIAMGLAFRGITLATEALEGAIPLPRPIERLHRRWSPWHASRDHLWHIYAHRDRARPSAPG